MGMVVCNGVSGVCMVLLWWRGASVEDKGGIRAMGVHQSVQPRTGLARRQCRWLASSLALDAAAGEGAHLVGGLGGGSKPVRLSRFSGTYSWAAGSGWGALGIPRLIGG